VTNDQENGRDAVRQRVLKGGIVAFNNRHSTLPCTVRDVSDAGARLRLDGSMNAPDTFDLIIELDGLEASCDVRWRRDKELGVRFVSAPQRLAPRRTQLITAVVPSGTPSLRRKPKEKDRA